MYAVTLFITTVFALGGVRSEFSERCENAKPAPEFEEKLCVSIKWYLYASNVPCENCLFIHQATWVENGLLTVTDTIQSNNETVVLNYIATREKHSFVYHLKLMSGAEMKEPKLVNVLDSDCRSEDRRYAISYEQTENVLQVFTSNLDVDESFVNSLDGVKKCNMKLYRYIREN